MIQRICQQRSRTRKADGLSSGGLEEALKSSPNRFKMFTGTDMRERLCRRAEANRLKAAEKSSQSSSGQTAALHELGNVSSPNVNHEEQYKPYLERGYDSPADMSDFVNPKASANVKKTQFHKSPKGSNAKGGDAVVEEDVEEVLK